MADNSSVPVAVGNETFANNDIGGVKYPRNKLTWGPAGTANDADVATGKPLPAQIRSATGLIPIGEPTDAAATQTDTTSVTAISIWKQISKTLQAFITLAGAPFAKITDGTNTATVRAASSGAAIATDTAVVVSMREGVITVGTAGSPSANVVTMQGAAAMTPVLGVPVASATANGQTSSRVNAANSTNATSLKASAGQIGEVDVFNAAAYVVFLKFYNKASAPTVGTDTPVWTVPIQAGGGYAKSFPRGKTFATGIAYAITKLQADSDTTVVAAGDLTGSIDWI